MDLSKVKVGDEVYSILRGWGKVMNINEQSFSVNFNKLAQAVYYFNGKYFESDINPEIFDWKKKRREWKPKDYPNGYTIWSNGDIDSDLEALKLAKEGRVYATREQAEYAYKSIRACQILNAYKAEFAPDWRPDWEDEDQEKFFVEQNDFINTTKWIVGVRCFCKVHEQVYFPKEIAEQLCKDLNDGVVKL